jgi:hypothetical protein
MVAEEGLTLAREAVVGAERSLGALIVAGGTEQISPLQKIGFGKSWTQ